MYGSSQNQKLTFSTFLVFFRILRCRRLLFFKNFLFPPSIFRIFKLTKKTYFTHKCLDLINLKVISIISNNDLSINVYILQKLIWRKIIEHCIVLLWSVRLVFFSLSIFFFILFAQFTVTTQYYSIQYTYQRVHTYKKLFYNYKNHIFYLFI